MADGYLYGLTGVGTQILPFGGANLSLLVVELTGLAVGGSRFPAPGQNKLAHYGWVAPAVELALVDMAAGLYFHSAVWSEFERSEHSFPAPGPYSSHLAWAFDLGVTANVYVLTV